MENKIKGKSKANIEAELIHKYWGEVEEKVSYILDFLKGTHYKQFKSIQRKLDEKIEERINFSTI